MFSFGQKGASYTGGYGTCAQLAQMADVTHFAHLQPRGEVAPLPWWPAVNGMHPLRGADLHTHTHTRAHTHTRTHTHTHTHTQRPPIHFELVPEVFRGRPLYKLLTQSCSTWACRAGTRLVLCIVSGAVVSTVLWCGVGAGSGSCLGPSSTCHGAGAPGAPARPASVHWIMWKKLQYVQGTDAMYRLI